MSKFIEEVKSFFNDMKYAVLGGCLFALSVFAVDYYGTESPIVKWISIFWLLVLLALILTFSFLGNPFKRLYNKLKELIKKKNDNISDKKE